MKRPSPAAGRTRRVVALVDGEHHPAAVRAAFDELRSSGAEIQGVVFCGGGEKVDLRALDEAYGVGVRSGKPLTTVLQGALEDLKPTEVVDLTDEPVLAPPERFRLASVALAGGASYRGADFDLRPPEFSVVLTKPSVSVYATGKRTGKTALAGALGRYAAGRGFHPVIVAMGRGGPNPPRVIEAGATLDHMSLLQWADEGLHASSDYVEDALMSGVTTIGCVRAGGGLAGATVFSNVVEAALLAESRSEDLVVLEGSGAAIPEVEVNARVVCVPAFLSPGEVESFLNPYRLLMANLCVVTMADEASAAAPLRAAIQAIAPKLDVVSVAFRPEPTTSVGGRKVFLCTTAPRSAGAMLKEHLEREHGCDVVGMTHELADRSVLAEDIRSAPTHDVLLTELKASAVDVAARMSVARSTEVVFVNNVPVSVEGGLEAAFDNVLSIAHDS